MHKLNAGTVARLLTFALAALSCAAVAANPDKVLRLATYDIETLDPHQYNDDPSSKVMFAIFEGLYEVDYLSVVPKLAPLTAVALPEITDGGKTWTVRIKPGIHFTDDPAFKGKQRELVAADYVYSIKRWLDPNLRRGGAPITTDLIVGARPVVDAASRPGATFDYDRPIEGLRALDRYTLQLKLTQPNYPIIGDTLITGAVAREVVDAAHGDIRDHPVGTGPYRLKEWKRGSRVVLEANPGYRPTHFPESDDPQQAALVRSMRGKTLPEIGVIELSVIEEATTRLLEFDRGRLDFIDVSGTVANRLLTNGKLKPEYATRGITRHAFPEPFLFAVYFNMVDPVVGGMGNDRIALRRAIAQAYDLHRLVDVVYAGQAIVANQLVPARAAGHDPAMPAKAQHDPATANALLDRAGYDKRDREGFRMAPGGKPLTLSMMFASGGVSREIQTLWKRNMDAVGLRFEFREAPFQDYIKELEAGKFQIYSGGYGGTMTGYGELIQLYSPEPSTVNTTRFKLRGYDEAMEQYLRSATSDAQIAAARTMSEMARTYMPILPTIFRLENDFVQPWLLGFSPPVFQSYWKYLDIDLAKRRQSANGQ